MRPLQDIHVVNTGINLPIVVAAARLAELGASVTKVEPPEGDPVRHIVPDCHAELTEGQVVLELDLKRGPDRAQLEELLAAADVLLTSARPAALERLGLGRDGLMARHPQLIQVALVGHPAPNQHVPGHDLTYVAHHGLLSPPSMPRTLTADLGGAERMVSTVSALLLARERGGGGAYAEVALEDAARFFSLPRRHGITVGRGILSGANPTYALYEADGGWIAVAALEPHFAERLLAELGLERADRDAMAAAFRARTPAAWEAWAHELDLPIAAVVTD